MAGTWTDQERGPGFGLVRPGERAVFLGHRRRTIDRVGIGVESAREFTERRGLRLERQGPDPLVDDQAVTFAGARTVEADPAPGAHQCRDQVRPRRDLGVQQHVEAAPRERAAQAKDPGQAAALVEDHELHAVQSPNEPVLARADDPGQSRFGPAPPDCPHRRDAVADVAQRRQAKQANGFRCVHWTAGRNMATIGPVMERILRSGATRILFDSTLDPAPEPSWFQPDEWRRNDAVVAEFGFGVIGTLGWYALAVVLGLALHLFGVYGLLLRVLTRGRMRLFRFYHSLASVHLLAFSSSSSAATLPLNMETVRDRLGVSERVTSFVLPLGATVNMDGTALYQGVAAVFIAQVYGLALTVPDQIAIVLTATLASIGTAAVPGAGLVMLVIVLETAGDRRGFEFQRLHGMGEPLYDQIVGPEMPVRVYAPVGSHEDLLAYLVRRLLENGANSSFVNRLQDDQVPVEDIVADPVERVAGLAEIEADRAAQQAALLEQIRGWSEDALEVWWEETARLPADVQLRRHLLIPEAERATLIGPDLAEDGLGVADAFEEQAAVESALDDALADERFATLRELGESPGFRQAVLNAIAALRLAGVAPARLGSAPTSNGRVRDLLVRVLAGYETALAGRGAVDTAEVLGRAARSLSEPEGGSGAATETSMTPELWRTYLVPGLSLRGATGSLVEALRAAGARALRSDPVEGLDPPGAVWEPAPEPAPLSSLMAPGGTVAPVELFAASGPADEIREVLRRVMAAGWRWDEVEIIATDPVVYGSALHVVAERLDIPVSFAVGLPVERTRPGRATAAWFRWVQSGFPADDIRRLLEAGGRPLLLNPSPSSSSVLTVIRTYEYLLHTRCTITAARAASCGVHADWFHFTDERV